MEYLLQNNYRLLSRQGVREEEHRNKAKRPEYSARDPEGELLISYDIMFIRDMVPFLH